MNVVPLRIKPCKKYRTVAITFTWQIPGTAAPNGVTHSHNIIAAGLVSNLWVYYQFKWILLVAY